MYYRLVIVILTHSKEAVSIFVDGAKIRSLQLQTETKKEV